MKYLIIAPQYQWARLIAEQLRHADGTVPVWHYCHRPEQLRGWHPTDVTILIHELWREVPVVRELQESNPDDYYRANSIRIRYSFPMRDQIEMLRHLGAKVRYVNT